MADAIDPGERLSVYDRDAAGLAQKFHLFGRIEAPELDSPMYAELSYGVSQDPELVALAARTRLGQPPPNMLFAAVQYLLLSGVRHELARHYPAISGEPRPAQAAFPAFRDFCLTHRDAIVALLESRLTQTNVIQRCACLLPAFATVLAEVARPLALLEVGPSAGLNLNFDRFRYTYVDAAERPLTTWGEPAATVTMSSVLRGGRLPALPDAVPVAWRLGVDVHPVDVDDADQLRWLRALIWPEHVERHQRLLAAADVARRHPPTLVAGDAVRLLPELLARAPADAALVVFATVVLYQIRREDRLTLLRALQAFAARQGRRVDLITMEATGARDAELALHTYRPDGRRTRELARVSPHGRWLRWTDAAAGSA